MFGLSLNPYVWLGALALLVGSYFTGYIKGAASERAEINLERAAVIVKRDTQIRKINASDAQLADAFERGREARGAEFKEIANELEKKLQALAADMACRLDDDAVRLLNRARSAAVSAPAGKPDGALPGSRQPEGWAPEHTRPPNDQGRRSLRDVRGPAEKGAGGTEAAATTRLTLQGLTP